MAWDWFKRKFNPPAATPKPPDSNIHWLAAADNPWGVPVLDVRPMTLGTISTSSNVQCAENAVSFGQEDGTCFIDQNPPEDRRVEADLRFPIDRLLADGVLYIPRQMEHKWAIFYHREKIICVRSWLRQVHVVAHAKEHGDHIHIHAIDGAFTSADEDPAFTARVLDYLLRSHALDTMYPAPLPPGMEEDPNSAAIWCMSMFGNRVQYATPFEFDPPEIIEPLRTNSLLHIAVARCDLDCIEACLAAGMPLDLLAADGLAPLHWALAPEELGILRLLLERGSPVDVRSSRGATALMNAVQNGRLDKVMLLLDHGADIDARDQRGFTALHRAAEMGKLDVTRLLVDRGALVDIEAQGHTPRSLAEARGEAEIVELLRRR